MVIQHNLTAMNANNQFKTNLNRLSVSTERLSSGYRINRAADDAAGLTISENMRLQIRGLNQGSKNIQDGISLIQVADGAMAEMADMIHRMKELSVKAYNGTNTLADRAAMQEEVGMLLDEFDRTAETTTFNTLQILKGNLYSERTEHHTADEPHMVYRTVDLKTLPSAFKGDSKIELDATSTFMQNTNLYMNQVVLGADGKIVKGESSAGSYVSGSYYCGPSEDKGHSFGGYYAYNGAWTPGSADNYQASFDLGKLQDCTTAKDLYSKVVELAGLSVSIPDVANQVAGLTFGFSYLTSDHEVFAPNIEKGLVVDLGKEVDRINDLDKSMRSSGKTASEIEAEVKKLGASIAKNITSQLEKMINNYTPSDPKRVDVYPFLRAVKENDTSLTIYDYRDATKLIGDKPKDIIYSRNAVVGSMEYEEWDELISGYGPLKIDCSAEAPYGDIIDIGLPNVSSDALGIRGYTICRYLEVDDFSIKASKAEWDKYEQDYVEYQKQKSIYDSLCKKEPIMEPYEEERYEWVIEKNVPKIVNGVEVGTQTEYEFGPIKKVSGVRESGKYKTIPPAGMSEPIAPERPKDMPTKWEYDPDDMTILDKALDKLLAWRADLGATQNRLEHAYRNNENKRENLTASESRVRDADMARESVENAKQNVLSQMNQAVLAQANQSKQGILQLLA